MNDADINMTQSLPFSYDVAVDWHRCSVQHCSTPVLGVETEPYIPRLTSNAITDYSSVSQTCNWCMQQLKQPAIGYCWCPASKGRTKPFGIDQRQEKKERGQKRKEKKTK